VKPEAPWRLACQSASINPTKPSGAEWDMGKGAALLPDTFCTLTVDGRSRSSSVASDTLTPEWDEDVTPSSGPSSGPTGPMSPASLTADMLTSPAGNWKLVVYDQDNVTMVNETVCTVMSPVTAADLAHGSVTFTYVDSCTSLVLGLTCAE
jgi:hypothetical protein